MEPEAQALTLAPVAGILACLLILPSDFDRLVSYFSASAWVIYSASAVALLRLRRTEPDLERPFRVAKPIPVLFASVGMALVVVNVLQRPLDASASLGFVLLGIPAYRLRHRWAHWGRSAVYSPTASYSVERDVVQLEDLPLPRGRLSEDETTEEATGLFTPLS